MANKNPWTKYILLLLIALILLGVNLLKNKKYKPTSENIFHLKIENITEINIAKDTLSVTLVKSDTSWTFAAPDTGEVSQDRVDRFLNNFVKKGKYTDYQTENPEKYSQYNITDEKATKITLKTNGEKKIALYAARSNSNWAHDYIRYTDDPKVYITADKIMYYFSERASFWRK